MKASELKRLSDFPDEATIDWLIRYIGDHGTACSHATIVAAGCKAGHNESTLRHYLGSAAGFGHVDPRTCNLGEPIRRARRPVYFERVRYGRYVLSLKGTNRYMKVKRDATSRWSLAPEAPFAPPLAPNKPMVEKKVEEVGVKSTDVGYNGDMPTISDAVLTKLNDVMGSTYVSAWVDLVRDDKAFSHEDTLYLTVELAPGGVELASLTAMAEELDVEYNDVVIGSDGNVTNVTFISWLDDVKWWLAEDPRLEEGKAPYPGMEFDTPDNFDHSLF